MRIWQKVNKKSQKTLKNKIVWLVEKNQQNSDYYRHVCARYDALMFGKLR